MWVTSPIASHQYFSRIWYPSNLLGGLLPIWAAHPCCCHGYSVRVSGEVGSLGPLQGLTFWHPFASIPEGACPPAKLLQSCWLSATMWTIVHQAPLSMGFFRWEYWGGLPCPPLGDLPDPGIEPKFPELAGGFFISSATWEALNSFRILQL